MSSPIISRGHSSAFEEVYIREGTLSVGFTNKMEMVIQLLIFVVMECPRMFLLVLICSRICGSLLLYMHYCFYLSFQSALI